MRICFGSSGRSIGLGHRSTTNWWQRRGRYDQGEAETSEWRRQVAVVTDALASHRDPPRAGGVIAIATLFGRATGSSLERRRRRVADRARRRCVATRLRLAHRGRPLPGARGRATGRGAVDHDVSAQPWRGGRRVLLNLHRGLIAPSRAPVSHPRSAWVNRRLRPRREVTYAAWTEASAPPVPAATGERRSVPCSVRRCPPGRRSLLTRRDYHPVPRWYRSRPSPPTAAAARTPARRLRSADKRLASLGYGYDLLALN